MGYVAIGDEASYGGLHFDDLQEHERSPAFRLRRSCRLKWFHDLKERWPDRFFHYYESDEPREVLLGLATFLGLEPEKEWLDWALQTFEIKSRYEHPAELVRAYEEDVCERFPAGSQARERLLEFTRLI